MKTMRIVPLETISLDNHHTRSCMIQRIDNEQITNEKRLWFRFSDTTSPPLYDDADSYVIAVIMDAMKEGRNIIVKGSVSRELLSNLVEYQAIWHTWLANSYKNIDIVVDSIRDNENAALGAICAFSGGVDGAFSVWRHSQNKYSYRSQTINLAVLVHGFDIPLSDTDAFINAKNNVSQTLEDVGIKVMSIETNFKQISRCSWEHTFACALVATLNNFKSVSGTCIIGSSDDYNHPRYPWGSTPLTDHLLSSDDFKVMHDGSSHSRTEKVDEISEWKASIDNLRVCWEGNIYDKNCGMCEKCLRTQANFLVLKKPIPSCFPDRDNIENKLNNLTQEKCQPLINEWKDILHYAKKNNIQSIWVKHIENIVFPSISSSVRADTENNCFKSMLVKYAQESTLVMRLFPKKSKRRKMFSQFIHRT